MNQARRYPKANLLVTGVVLLCLPMLAWPGQETALPELVVMSAVSDDPQSLIATMRPLANYMATKLAPLGVENVDILIAENHAQMIRFIRDGRVDWITETAYSAVLLEQSAGAEMLLRKWKQGFPNYHSVVFVREDSAINTLEELQGRSIAFQHPGSTTGYFVPKSLLHARTLSLHPLRSVREQPRPGFVNYLFSGAEYNSAMWVDKGIVSAGVLSNLDWQREEYVPSAVRQNLKIIYTSAPLPRAVELVRGDLDPRVKAAIRQTLLEAHDDPDAREALRSYQMTLRFDELDMVALRALREISNSLKQNDTEVQKTAGAP